MELTKQSILSDIEGYHQRIEGAKLKLAYLPVDGSYKEKRKAKAATRALTSEVDHVTRMVGYARQALVEVEKGDS